MFPGSLDSFGNWCGAIRPSWGSIRTDASALRITLGIGASDGCFQTRAAGGEYLKLRLYALLLDLELAATRFT